MKKSIILLLVPLFFSSFSYVFADTCASNTVVENDNSSFGNSSGNQAFAQQFTASASCTVTSITSKGEKIGSPTDLSFAIYSDSGSDTVGSLLGSVCTGTNWTGSNADATISCSSGATVVSGTKYWIVWDRTGSVDGSNYYKTYDKYPMSGGARWSLKASGTWGSPATNVQNMSFTVTGTASGGGGGGGGGSSAATSSAMNVDISVVEGYAVVLFVATFCFFLFRVVGGP